jgi:DeoR/GlpR family transcriptional regulator of sugar metabolism
MRCVLELLDTRDSVQVSKLAAEFLVSEVTVRQDLAELARQRLVVRVRGGVRALQQGQSEVAFDARLRLQAREKRAIARAAAALVGDGEAVALDSSTSAYYLALELRHKRELIVVTNGLLVAGALADAPGVSVLVTGGLLRLPALSLVGEQAIELVRTTYINTGFFGARGLSLDRGLMDLHPEEVRLKKELVNVSEGVVGICDRTKWQRDALLSFVSTDRVHAIVTDIGAPTAEVAAWRARGVEVVLAEPLR